MRARDRAGQRCGVYGGMQNPAGTRIHREATRTGRGCRAAHDLRDYGHYFSNSSGLRSLEDLPAPPPMSCDVIPIQKPEALESPLSLVWRQFTAGTARRGKHPRAMGCSSRVTSPERAGFDQADRAKKSNPQLQNPPVRIVQLSRL